LSGIQSRNFFLRDRCNASFVKNILVDAGYSHDIKIHGPLKLGTLGVCFYVKDCDKTYFLKICLNDKVHNDLISKEIHFIGHVYGDLFSTKWGEVDFNGAKISWILLPYFSTNICALTPLEAKGVIEFYQSKLKTFDSQSIVQERFTFDSLLKYAHIARNELLKNNLISQTSYQITLDNLCEVESTYTLLNPTICHGDLSPKNIMRKEGQNLAIDWEDAFLAFDGYDYLYWLTFIENRAYYNNGLLGKANVSIYFEVSVMAVIVLLKSWLSLLDGSIAKHRISIDDRLNQIFSLSE